MAVQQFFLNNNRCICIDMIKLGIDTGGTFTDFILHTDNGMETLKLPSTPENPAKAILEGLSSFFSNPPDTLEIIHGTTVGTNAFLQRKGAKTILITTHGFEDVLFIGRQNRAKLYDLNLRRPPEIIDRNSCVGVKERTRWDGSIQQPLGKTVGKRVRSLARKVHAQSIAICLLHSYANPEHEKQLQASLRDLEIPVTLSSELIPEFREYERLCTTLINAYIAPVISSYIESLAAQLPGIPVFVQQSNGGILPAAGIADHAVQTILSGPAGGVYGAFHLAGEIGLSRIVTFDMGGTSTDVSLCDRALTMTRDYAIEGFPIRTQVIDIHTVGAGGGSHAWIDAGGLLQVGPESAGADPGPVCYGTGQRITVTDANLFLGRLLPDRFLGGKMVLEKERVDQYMEILAEQLSMSSVDVALGIIKIVNANMVKAIRAVSVERGHDPGEFSLFAFGGAAGLHCCELASDLGINRIVIPNRAGILSAQGMILSEPTLDHVQAHFLSGSDLTKEKLAAAFSKLEGKARKEADALNPANAQYEIRRFLDLRYKGQSHELTTPFVDDFMMSFHNAHQYAYGYDMQTVPLELVSIRLSLRMIQPMIKLPRCGEKTASLPQPLQMTDVYFENGSETLPLYLRKDFKPGNEIAPPALIVDSYTTILLPDGFALRVDSLLNLIIDRISEYDNNY